MKKKVYIFSGESRASTYGIGTYMNQLIEALKDGKIDFGIVYLYADNTEILIEEKDGYQQISIPRINRYAPKGIHSYERNIAFLLKEVIQTEKDDQIIFHLNFMTHSTMVTYLKRLFKCHIILTIHYTNWSFNLLGNYKRMQEIIQMESKQLDECNRRILKEIKENALLIKKCDLVICVAQHTVNTFIGLNCLRKTPVIVINNALKDCYQRISEMRRMELRKKYYIDSQTRVIFFAGRLDKVKGVPFLIQAFEETLKSFPNSRLLIAGNGNFEQCINATNHCWSKISFTGKLKKEQLYELYSIADIGIVCSLHEEFGFVAIEMMMQCLPLIVSNTSGLTEIVIDGETGLKVPIDTRNNERYININKLSEQINYLLENPTLALQLSINARKRFLEKYELNLFKEKMLAVYNS